MASSGNVKVNNTRRGNAQEEYICEDLCELLSWNPGKGVVTVGDVKLPEDYAIDGLSLEADRRAKQLGGPYSYGQLIADTTIAQREVIVEDYRKAAVNASKQGRYSVKGGTKLPAKVTVKKAETEICKRLETMIGDEKAGE